LVPLFAIGKGKTEEKEKEEGRRGVSARFATAPPCRVEDREARAARELEEAAHERVEAGVEQGHVTTTTRRDTVTSLTLPRRSSRPRLHRRPSVNQRHVFSSPHPWERAPASRRRPLSRALFVRPPSWRTPTPRRSSLPFSRFAIVYPCPSVEP
jgi:hypothetical protein